ncbi:hypothetical protein Sru01_38050 [Sphaerisporangium rufum]|uniref:histidine kinase n=1 Tax=Sphaerisporangium rufum TaxID=1381558 RepID=A0A919V2D3_9ACTN|nr:hypothetical protein Sru01_38050 [Sphaerisporangium rufum]
MYAGVTAALLSALLATVLMIAVNRLATAYRVKEVTATGSRVVFEIERAGLRPQISADVLHRHQVLGATGRILAASPGMEGRPRMATFAPAGNGSTASAVVCHGGDCDIVVAHRVYHRSAGSLVVYSSAPAIPPLVHPKLATLVIGGSILLAVAVTYGAHRLVAGSLAPVDVIRAELDAINARDPGRRVPVPRTGDEIHDLAVSVNRTLERLQRAIERQRRFASDASHDLRSPLTAMRAEVEEALLAPGETDVRDLGRSLLTSLDRLQALVADLLMAARLDAGDVGAREPVDLGALVAGELTAHRHNSPSVETRLEPGIVVLGDPPRLARLLTNLVDNAERHATSLVVVSLRREPGDDRFPHGTAVLEVLDDGAGIPPDQREAVFQRFARLEEGRRLDPGGTGLGLAIARQIAEAGGGSLSAEPGGRGARLVLRLPVANPGASPPGENPGGSGAPGPAAVPPAG